MSDVDHWGKIACHFPDRETPNLEVADIKFLANGVSSLSHIDRVYMLPHGVTVSTVEDLQKYIVWTTDLTLQQLSDPIAIEYVPTGDMNLTDIAIFTTDEEQSQTINFAIYHESGLVVAKSNGDTTTETTFFGTSGYRRNTVVDEVTLKKGYKYYIQYTNSNNTFKPIAMHGWVGNYLKWTHDATIQNKSIANINDTTGYQSSVLDIAGFVAVPTGNFFKWNYSTYGTTSGKIYVRNNVGHEGYGGIVGSGNLSSDNLDTILKFTENTMYIWAGNENATYKMKTNNFHIRNDALATAHYKGIIDNRSVMLDHSYDVGDYTIYEKYGQITIYQKTSGHGISITINFDDYSSYSYAVQTAILIKASSQTSSSSGPNSILTFGNFYGVDKNGYVYTLQTGKTYDFTLEDNVLGGYTTSNPPLTYVTDCIYYLENSGSYNGMFAQSGLNLWTGSGWTPIAKYNDNLDVIFDIETNLVEQCTADVTQSVPIENIGDATALVSESYDTTYQAVTLTSQQVWTDQKYYLKLNDTEV